MQQGNIHGADLKANAAIQARGNGDIEEAVSVLKDFINQIQELTPKKIAPETAEHMIHHAIEAIKALKTYT